MGDVIDLFPPSDPLETAPQQSECPTFWVRRLGFTRYEILTERPPGGIGAVACRGMGQAQLYILNATERSKARLEAMVYHAVVALGCVAIIWAC